LKSKGFCILATKKKSLALHVYWTTNKKERRMHDFRFVEERGVFSLMVGCPLLTFSLSFYILGNCCDVAVAQINYPSFKHNTQDSIEQARGRSHEEDSSKIFMLDDMQFRGGLDVI